MNRREFLKAAGLTAAVVAVGGVSLADAGEVALSETFHVGDIFTIAGRYAVSPHTGVELPFLQQFMTTAIQTDTVSFHPSRFSLVDPPLLKRHIMPLGSELR